jgi:hypothetical protein
MGDDSGQSAAGLYAFGKSALNERPGSIVDRSTNNSERL